MSDVAHELASVGPRIRAIRTQQRLTLAQLAAVTSISESTISRLERGGRKPTLELLLTIARGLGVPLDDLVTPASDTDPRVPQHPLHRPGRTMIPLSRRPGLLQAYKFVLAPTDPDERREPGVHDGYEWLYVLSGRIALTLGDEELIIETGEVAEFDTRLPHLIRNPGPTVAEMITLFGPQGERMHVKARTEPR